MTTPTPLTGDALKARVADLGQLPQDRAAIECGYATETGKPRIAAFKQALMDAHGLVFAKPSKGTGSKGKPLSFKVTAGKTGNIVMAGGYAKLIGVEPSGEVVISHQGSQLVLTAATPTPTATPEPVGEAAVVTYDSTPAAAPALTPF